MMCPEIIPRIHILLYLQQSGIFVTPEALLPVWLQSVSFVQIGTASGCNVTPLLHSAICESRSCSHDGRCGCLAVNSKAIDDVVNRTAPCWIDGIVRICAASGHVKSYECLACFG